ARHSPFPITSRSSPPPSHYISCLIARPRPHPPVSSVTTTATTEIYTLSLHDALPISITVERLDDGEASPYLVDEVKPGDRLELRGPIGGYFVWEAQMGGPLLLVGGGSGIVPLMAMIRHRRAVAGPVPARLLYSQRSQDEG